MFLLLACATYDVVDREPGAREPVTRSCDAGDELRCFLPWPSSAFMEQDPSTTTGLRIAVDGTELPVDDAGVDYLNLADGFSRATGVAAGFDEQLTISAPTPALNDHLYVFNVEPGHPHYGVAEPFFTELIDATNVSDERTLLVGRPVGVLAENSEHLVVILDTIGNTTEVPRGTLVALALVEPESEEEARVQGYHAPHRAFLDEQGIEPESVVRFWDFTTRSNYDTTRRTHSMMATLDDAIDGIDVEIDSVTTKSDPRVAAVVRGRLTGAPSFLTDEDRLDLVDGEPQVTGTQDIEFRISLPAGESEVPFKVALYGHGTGGNVSDGSFDEDIAGHDIAKLNLRFDGWTDEDFVLTLASFTAFFEGSERSSAGLMQSIAGGTVLLTALDGVLGEVFADLDIDGTPYGRTPRTDQVVWLGGSLGGTLGAVIVAADERLRVAVLNVPGAGWTHLIPHSLLYDVALGSVMKELYGDELDVQLAILMGQTSWDDVDGAVWADEALEAGGAFLLQEVMDDPVLPNLGTDILASALNAKQFSPALKEIEHLEQTDGVVFEGATLEQFRVPDGLGVYQHHGFAARSTPAGDAALEQILEFLDKAWEGETPMSRPDICLEQGLNGTCDFSEAWEPE
mgnify:CR=1 FL=1